jgi:sporulation protein YhbH
MARRSVRSALPEIIAEESIITSDGKRLVKVPIRSLEEYRFRFDPHQGDKVGQGDGDSQVGDVIGQEPGSGQQAGQGKQAGDKPGVDYYEAEVTVDDLAELIFEDLGLPDLRPKATQEVPTDTVKFTEVRKKGPMSNLDKRRTIMENLKRNAMHGQPGFGGINNDDLRFKVWEQETRPSSSAVVLAMRDASGSMGEFKKYITRSLFFWMKAHLPRSKSSHFMFDIS